MSSSKTVYLALVGAGESIWATEDRITGWIDLPLSEIGLYQAREAAAMLGTKNIRFSAAFTSMMKRGIHTLNIILDELDINYIKYKKHWRLNPQHYGALEQQTKEEIISQHGEDSYNDWIFSYEGRPPEVDFKDERHPSNQAKYSNVPAAILPCSESLKETENRVKIYWADKIAPALLSGKNVLVVTHRNTIKAFRSFLGDVDENGIKSLSVPSGIPRVYEFSDKLKIAECYYLADDEEVRNRMLKA